MVDFPWRTVSLQEGNTSQNSGEIPPDMAFDFDRQIWGVYSFIYLHCMRMCVYCIHLCVVYVRIHIISTFSYLRCLEGFRMFSNTHNGYLPSSCFFIGFNSKKLYIPGIQQLSKMDGNPD